MDTIDLRPEHRAELAELTIQKELYLTLVLKLQELTDTVKPNLEALYAVKIGHKELDLLQKQAEVAGLKYKMELLIACINRQEQINIDDIEQMVQLKLTDYYNEINREAERIENAQIRLDQLISPSETAEMKKLYYEVAKMLHPDVNPSLSDEQKQLWNVISEAYKNGDFQTIRNVAAAIGGLSTIPEETHDYDSLNTQIALFQGRNKLILDQITNVHVEFPFTFRDKLQDEEWVKSEHLIVDRKMQELNETAIKYLGYIDLIMEN